MNGAWALRSGVPRLFFAVAVGVWPCRCGIALDEEKVRAALAALQDSDGGNRRKHSLGLRQLQEELNRLERDSDRDRDGDRPDATLGNDEKEEDIDNESCDESNGSLNGTSVLARSFRSAYLAEEARRGRARKFGDKRRNYMEEKLRVDREVLRACSVPSVLPAWPGNTRQVAFLFMTEDGLDFEDLWDKFFGDASAYGAYSIYVHRAGNREKRLAERFSGWTMPWSATLPLSRWGAVELPQVETRWCALFGLEVALLARALQDPHNQQFVFVSHNTIPLKSFNYVYKQLVLDSSFTSKFCFAEPAFHKLASYETIRNEPRRTCVFRDFWRSFSPRTLKHHQWVVLSREHAAIVVRRAQKALDTWHKSWIQAAPDLLHMAEGCSDESAPIDALLYDLEHKGSSTGNTWADLTRMGIEQQCLTFVLWRHCFTETRLEYSENIAKDLDAVLKHGELRMLTDREFNFFKSALKRELNGYPAIFDSIPIDYLWKLVQEGFMFARKFVKGVKVKVGDSEFSLDMVLPLLWDIVDDFNASQRVWSRLSIEGKPRPI